MMMISKFKQMHFLFSCTFYFISDFNINDVLLFHFFSFFKFICLPHAHLFNEWMSLMVEQYTLLKDEFISVLSRHKVQKSKLNKKKCALGNFEVRSFLTICKYCNQTFVSIANWREKLIIFFWWTLMSMKINKISTQFEV